MRKMLFKYRSAFNTKWRIIDSHWVNVYAAYIDGASVLPIDLYKGTLADFLWDHCFDIPPFITYCIAENERFYLKFRQSGGLINIFINFKQLQKMNVLPHLEINCIPSQLNTSAPTGVASQLATMAENQPKMDGVTIENMRNNPIYDRGDKIDKVGKVQRTIADRAKIVKSKSKMIRALNEHAQNLQKPKNN